MENNYVMELKPYEEFLEIYYVGFRVKINKIYEKEKYINAIKKLMKEYPYLRSVFIENGKKLKVIDDLEPLIKFYDTILIDNEYYSTLKEIIKESNCIGKYVIMFNKEKNESEIVGLVPHSCCAGGSAFHMCDKLLLYLSDESIEIKPRKYIPSNLGNAVNIKPNKIIFEKYLDKDIIPYPTLIHEEKDKTKIISKYYSQLLKPDEIKPILTYCHNNSISLQPLFWLADIISQINMAYKSTFDELPKKVRYYTNPSLFGRMEFNPPIDEDDISDNIAMLFINEVLDKNDKIIDHLVKLTNDMKGELESKQQFYDFFSTLDNLSFPISTLGGTLGVLPNKSNYKEFDVLDVDFLTPVIDNGMPRFITHIFTYKNLGTYICCNYSIPHFTDKEIEKYVNEIVILMNYICNEENKDKKIAELIKLIN